MTLPDTVLLVGGNGLIGRALCESLLASGTNVVVTGRSSTPDTTQYKGKAFTYIQANATVPEDMDRVFSQTLDKIGPIRAVVNLAFPRNKNHGQKFEDVSYSDFQENVSDHIGSYFLVAQKAVSHFEAHGGGNLINVSSVYGLMAPRFDIYDNTDMTKEVEYALSKAAIIQLTKYLARYLKGQNIRVNTVSPGGVFDNQDPDFVKRYEDYCINKGMLDAKDLVGSIRFLLSDDSAFINGQNLTVDDGFSL